MVEVNTLCLDWRLSEVPKGSTILTRVVKAIGEVLEVSLTPQLGREQLLQDDKAVLKRGTLGCWESIKDDVLLIIRLYDRTEANKEEKKLFILTATLEYRSELGVAISNREGRPTVEVFEERIVLEEDKANDENNEYLRFVLPPIRRGLKDPPYLSSSDDRIFEYRVESVLFSRQSKYQRIQIFDTIDFGPMLVLDDYVNLAESDREAYTLTLMDVPKEDYGGKEVLILGGGDGALINELMKLDNKPAHVTMVDIDDVVMDACREFMPNACGNWLDPEKRSGPNHKIIVGDAIAFMKEAKAAGRYFDYVFGDLTDIPVRAGPEYASGWQFIESIVKLALGLLKPGSGKYLSHSNGVNVLEAVSHYEDMLRKLNATFTRRESFVPSFMETWLLYTIVNNQ